MYTDRTGIYHAENENASRKFGSAPDLEQDSNHRQDGQSQIANKTHNHQQTELFKLRLRAPKHAYTDVRKPQPSSTFTAL